MIRFHLFLKPPRPSTHYKSITSRRLIGRGCAWLWGAGSGFVNLATASFLSLPFLWHSCNFADSGVFVDQAHEDMCTLHCQYRCRSSLLPYVTAAFGSLDQGRMMKSRKV
ncbi:hypothetical protein PGT21_025387 [Puccinia graminis f. sp. tritici]|uniref:Uncharacterized protein n=1 Tax=Puccinia graminis f. sp. tritici TaxID=56615 RepID=A0A5B0QX17_PUCGR|nr:hypothetical protein PGT21_025387 [Puccinia graminis f. sp. tritici]